MANFCSICGKLLTDGQMCSCQDQARTGATQTPVQEGRQFDPQTQAGSQPQSQPDPQQFSQPQFVQQQLFNQQDQQSQSNQPQPQFNQSAQQFSQQGQFNQQPQQFNQQQFNQPSPQFNQQQQTQFGQQQQQFNQQQFGQQQFQPGYNPGGQQFYGGVRSDNRKTYCILSYISILWLIGLLSAPEKFDPRVRFNVGQGIILSIVSSGLSIIVFIISTILRSVMRTEEIFYGVKLGISYVSPVANVISIILWLVVSAFIIGFSVMGILNVVNNRDRTLPVIGNMSFYR